jgi:hypothetical protein
MVARPTPPGGYETTPAAPGPGPWFIKTMVIRTMVMRTMVIRTLVYQDHG